MNPEWEEVHIEKCFNVELLDGYENWSLKDIIFKLEIMEKNGPYGIVLLYFGKIILKMVLEASNDQKVPFDLIKETICSFLETSVDFGGDNVLGAFRNIKAISGKDYTISLKYLLSAEKKMYLL